jgi:hypothetical protein
MIPAVDQTVLDEILTRVSRIGERLKAEVPQSSWSRG